MQTLKDADEFQTFLLENTKTVKVYTDKSHTTASEMHGAGDIIITTRLGSRGTDWKVSDDCTNGLHVV